MFLDGQATAWPVMAILISRPPAGKHPGFNWSSQPAGQEHPGCFSLIEPAVG